MAGTSNVLEETSVPEWEEPAQQALRLAEADGLLPGM